jgi:hypothetical protein
LLELEKRKRTLRHRAQEAVDSLAWRLEDACEEKESLRVASNKMPKQASREPFLETRKRKSPERRATAAATEGTKEDSAAAELSSRGAKARTDEGAGVTAEAEGAEAAGLAVTAASAAAGNVEAYIEEAMLHIEAEEQVKGEQVVAAWADEPGEPVHYNKGRQLVRRQLAEVSGDKSGLVVAMVQSPKT